MTDPTSDQQRRPARRRPRRTPPRPAPADPVAAGGQDQTPPAVADDTTSVWVPDPDAASWSAHQTNPPASAVGDQPQRGRVRVFPTYDFPVYQSHPGGIGLDQTITITDWRKQGAQWAEQEARRQVGAALGTDPDENGDLSWWMGRPKKGTFRWLPYKGTPRDALPVNPEEQTVWEPARPDPAGEQVVHAEEKAASAEDQVRAALRDIITSRPEDSRGNLVHLAELRARLTGLTRSEQDDALRALSRQDPAFDLYPNPARNEHTEREQAAGLELGGEQQHLVGYTGGRQTVADAGAAVGEPVLRPGDVQPGDEVYDSGAGENATVAAADGESVTIDYGRETIPGIPQSRQLRIPDWGLTPGVLRRTSADLPGGGERRMTADIGGRAVAQEEARPPADQAARFAERRGHYLTWRGDGDVPAPGYAEHAAGCGVCSDMDRGGDGVGRRLRVRAGAVPTFMGGVPGQARHPAVEAVLDAAHTHIAAYAIPDDLTGVRDVDSLVGSLGPLMEGIGASLTGLAAVFGESPVHASVVEMLGEFAGSFSTMADSAGEVYAEWRDNPDNAHDRRRAFGQIPRASLFNV